MKTTTIKTNWIEGCRLYKKGDIYSHQNDEISVVTNVTFVGESEVQHPQQQTSHDIELTIKTLAQEDFVMLKELLHISRLILKNSDSIFVTEQEGKLTIEGQEWEMQNGIVYTSEYCLVSGNVTKQEGMVY